MASLQKMLMLGCLPDLQCFFVTVLKVRLWLVLLLVPQRQTLHGVCYRGWGEASCWPTLWAFIIDDVRRLHLCSLLRILLKLLLQHSWRDEFTDFPTFECLLPGFCWLCHLDVFLGSRWQKSVYFRLISQFFNFDIHYTWDVVCHLSETLMVLNFSHCRSIGHNRLEKTLLWYCSWWLYERWLLSWRGNAMGSPAGSVTSSPSCRVFGAHEARVWLAALLLYINW